MNALVVVPAATASTAFASAVAGFNLDAYPNAVATFASALRRADTIVDNASATYGRETLRGMLSGDFSPRNVALAAYEAFAPKSPASGKACEPSFIGDMVKSVSSLRNAKGGDSARKTLESLFNIAAIVASGADDKGEGKVRVLIAAFLNDEKGACSSVRTLEAAVNAAMKDEGKRIAPPVQTEANAPAPAAPADAGNATPSLADMVAATLALWADASDDDKRASLVAIEALSNLAMDFVTAPAADVRLAA